MNYRLMFAINAIAVALVGAGLLAVPETILTQFSAETYVSVIYLCRFLGGTLLLLAWFIWLVRDMIDTQGQRNVAMVMLGSSVAGFAFVIMGMSRSFIGVLRTNGWMLLVVFGLFILIYGYLLFLQPRDEGNSNPQGYRKVV
jgi:hypothetical protein